MRVLVTDATRNVGVSVIHSLAKEGHEIIAIDNRKLPLSSKSSYAAKFFPTPDFDHTAYGDAIFEIINKTKPDIILPVLNVAWYTKNIGELKKHAKILYPEHDKFMVAYNNQNTIKRCNALNIPAPKLFDVPEAKAYLERGKTKGHNRLVVKPQLDFGGGRGVTYVSNVHDVEMAMSNVEKKYGEAFIQEYIPGGEDSMVALNLLFGDQSNLIAGFAFQKLRQWPRSGGTTALGISVAADPYIEMMMPFFDKLKWRGPVDIEIKLDDRDGIPKLIEINPRFTGAIAFSFHCGINMPHIYCMSAVGSENQIQKTTSYAQGEKFVNVFLLIKSALKKILFSSHKTRAVKELLIDLSGRKHTYKIYKGDYLIRFSKFLFELKRTILKGK